MCLRHAINIPFNLGSGLTLTNVRNDLLDENHVNCHGENVCCCPEVRSEAKFRVKNDVCDRTRQNDKHRAKGLR